MLCLFGKLVANIHSQYKIQCLQIVRRQTLYLTQLIKRLDRFKKNICTQVLNAKFWSSLLTVKIAYKPFVYYGLFNNVKNDVYLERKYFLKTFTSTVI